MGECAAIGEGDELGEGIGPFGTAKKRGVPDLLVGAVCAEGKGARTGRGEEHCGCLVGM